MALAQRIAALQKRHEWLDQILSQEMHYPFPDEVRLTQIKKSKLRVKDEIVSLQSLEHKILPSFHREEEFSYRRAVGAH